MTGLDIVISIAGSFGIGSCMYLIMKIAKGMDKIEKRLRKLEERAGTRDMRIQRHGELIMNLQRKLGEPR